MHASRGRGRRVWLATLTLALACAAPAAAAGIDGDSASSDSKASSLSLPDQGLASRDVRIDAQKEPAQPVSAAAARAQANIRESLGSQGVVDVDPITGTPRVVADLNGFLTGPSDASPKAIALGYLHRHAKAFGLDAGDISSLQVTHSYTDVRGTTHLIWAQVFNGIQALDNGVYANVTKDGRLINVMGSPVSDLGVRTTQPDVSARGALSTALGNAGVPSSKVPAKKSTRGADSLTNFAGGADDTRLVLFTEGPGVTRLAWRVTAEASSTELYDYVIDASTGKVLYRENTVDFAASGRVWEYAPNLNSVCAGCGAPAGAQTDHNFSVTGWNTQATRLQGSNAHVYTDVNDDNQVDSGIASCPNCGDIPPNLAGPAWTYNFAPNPGDPTFETGFDCSATFPQCSWYLHNPGWQGWASHIRQNSTQVYWFVNNFHDWLENNAAIGFNNASGNFEGVDAVNAETFDGAASDTSPGSIPGTPDDDHVNNANMSTQKDGIPPRMQMYLFYQPGSQDVQTNGGDDATVMYHEYTHGLSNRLVLDTSGAPALKSFQARSMGEGWSDWYALDYLEGNNLDEDDTALDGQMNMAVYALGGDIHSLRSEGLDCQVASANTTDCPGGDTTGTGGYTLGDMGHVTSGPEVHADGEIWAQTIWDLRHNAAANGFTVNQIRTIVTDGMRLSVPDPSMLDMRNAIVQATTTDFPGNTAFRNFVWQTFANRGMGYFASDSGSSDTTPTQAFNTPPTCGACGTLSGKVTDADAGTPVANTTIAIRGAGDLVATTNANGNYSINNVPPHTYELLTASRVGFNPAQRTNVAVGTGTTTLNLTIRRDWAAISGGGQVVSFSPPNYTSFGCGPSGAFDLSLGSGWGSTSISPADTSNGPGGPKSVVVKLPKPIDLASFAVDPGATCGDDDSASTRSLRIQTSPNNTTYTTVAQPAFSATSNHHLNTVAPTSHPKKVLYVKATMLANQNGFIAGTAGQNFMDLSELEVYGKPSDVTKPVITGATIQAGQTVRSIIANGFKISSHLSEAGTEKGTLMITAAKAQQLGIPRTIGTGTLAFTAAATKTMTMNLTAQAKNKLQNQNNLAVTATLNATDKALNKATPVSKSTTLPH
jgi:extracellular elastinolytic metalloproteinase